MKNIIVCDIDGTLANVEHRRHFVTGKKRNYEAFHASAINDEPNEWCKWMLEAFKVMGLHRIVLVSARPESELNQTKTWLDIHSIKYDELYLVRKVEDYTPDVELKRDWLRGYEGKNEIAFCIDDRQRIVDMWRAEGLTCLQCDAWEERK